MSTVKRVEGHFTEDDIRTEYHCNICGEYRPDVTNVKPCDRDNCDGQLLPREVNYGGTYVPGYRLVECECGEEVRCDRFTNTCVCGREYSMDGGLLRSNWRREVYEETGEDVYDL